MTTARRAPAKPTRKTPELVTRLRDMVASGAKTSDIARDIGISRTTVRVWAQEEGISRLSHIEAIKANSLMRKLKGAEIPHWVPSDLRGEFVEWVAEADEFEAAAHIREIKRARREERAS